MRIVSSTSTFTMLLLCIFSFLFGVLLFLPLLVLIPIAPYLIDPVAGRPTFVSIACTYAFLAFTTLIGPMFGLVVGRAQIADVKRRTAAILSCSAGVLSPAYLLSASQLIEEGELEVLSNTIFWHAGLCVAWSLIAFFLLPIITRTWPLRMQDGESCPRCGYCVRGVASRICPECGRAFSESDLGLTAAQFEYLINGNTHVLHRTVD